VNVMCEVKFLRNGAEAKASLNRANSTWYSDVKRDDLSLVRMKLR
jgi:hypothetical protein